MCARQGKLHTYQTNKYLGILIIFLVILVPLPGNADNEGGCGWISPERIVPVPLLQAAPDSLAHDPVTIQVVIKIRTDRPLAMIEHLADEQTLLDLHQPSLHLLVQVIAVQETVKSLGKVGLVRDLAPLRREHSSCHGVWH